MELLRPRNNILLQTGRSEECLLELPDNYCDSINTDPPYNEVNRATGGLRTIDKGESDSEPVDIPFFAEQFSRLAKQWIFVWSGINHVSHWTNAFKELGHTYRLGIWRKTNPSPLNCDKDFLSDIECCVIVRHPKAYFRDNYVRAEWNYPSERIKFKGENFPCRKSRKVIQAQLWQTTRPEELILDPFMGSGSSAEAALNLGRRYHGLDYNEEYVEWVNENISRHR